MKKYIISVLSLFCLYSVLYADTHIITTNSGADATGTFRNTFKNKRNKTVGDTIVFNISGSDIINLDGELFRIKDGSMVVDGLNQATGNPIVVVAKSSNSIFRSDGTADGSNTSGLDITFKNITFKNANITASGTKHGGGFYVGHTNLPLLSTFRFINCTFENCSTTSSGGGSPRAGAIGVANNSSLIVDSCTFIGNSATNTGAAISSIQANSYINIRNSVFESNTSSNGGAVYVNSNFPAFITGCTFYNNTGGALYINSGSSTTISVVNNTFYQNTSSKGSGIFVNSDNPNSIINCTVVGNKLTTSEEGNGAIYANATGSEGNPAVNSSLLINCIVSGTVAITEEEETEPVEIVTSDVYGQHLTLSNCIVQTTDASVTSGRITNPVTYAPSVFVSDIPVLSDNGGATKTIAVSSSGAAYGAGISGADIPTTDQRGVLRGENPCVGAFEAQTPTGYDTRKMLHQIHVGAIDMQIIVKSEKPGVVSIYDTVGRILSQKHSFEESVFTVPSKGLYIVNFKENASEYVHTQKVIVK